MTRHLNLSTKNWKRMAFGFVLFAGSLIALSVSDIGGLRSGLSISLVGLSMLLMLGAALPIFYENWIQHGKSKRAFVFIMAIFFSVPVLVIALGLATYFGNPR